MSRLIHIPLLVSILFIAACAPIDNGNSGINGIDDQTKPFLNKTLPQDKVIISSSCLDTDKGVNPPLKGAVTDEVGNEWVDFCRSELSLNEYHCETYDGRKHSRLIDCSTYGNKVICKDGECVYKEQKYSNILILKFL